MRRAYRLGRHLWVLPFLWVMLWAIPMRIAHWMDEMERRFR